MTLVVSTAAAGPKATPAPTTPVVFPVLGPTTYTDDFGDPRPGGRHQGIDILAPKRALALAAEAGKVKFWTRSASAGCMLYLYGASGTTYYYIHLNNDLTKQDDNRGKCVAGTAYAKGLKNGAKVSAGQVIGYVGDSGDANGLHPHLHFEVHPGRGAAVDPYPTLQTATHLLFAVPRGTPFTLKLRGKITAVSEDAIRIKVRSVSAWPMAQKQPSISRTLLVLVPSTAIVQSVRKFGAPGASTDLMDATEGESVELWTSAAPATLKAERGDDLALSASLISVAGP
ncbi:MAG TPA: M23 family metallopeptidase [Gaiellaceae bacterium]|nr:M23 family metallopeptidase [Gaiellaceae bacterium]